MPEEQKNDAPEVNDTDSTSKVNEPILKGANPVAERARQDIYNRFDKQQEAPKTPDSSSEKEESDSADLKQSPETDDSPSEKDEVKKSEKPTSVKKRKEPKKEEPEEPSEKMVPLPALHESRERFKKLNLDFREYKASKDKEIQELREQVKALAAKLDAPKDDISVDDIASDTNDPKQQAILKKLAEFENEKKQVEQEKQRRAAEEAQQAIQKRIQQTDEELAKEGFKGFSYSLLKVEERLKSLVQEGDITDEESRSPDTWKKVFKEDIHPALKNLFIESQKKQISNEKVNRKKGANLNDYAGKPDKQEIEEDDDTPLSAEDFSRQQIQEILAAQRKKYSRK